MGTSGGWGDIGFTPSEITKEIQEETGLDAKVIKLLAVIQSIVIL